MKEKINKSLFKNYSPEKIEYKSKDLYDELKIWHKIILNCINPRPSSSSYDYFNVNQKYMLYYLMTHQKMCLPALMFHYLRDSISKTRTTDDPKKKVSNYIPFGRLITDILVENGLVKIRVEEAKFTEDPASSLGDSFNG